MKNDKKLSEIILEIIEPFHNGELHQMKTLIEIAKIAWNNSIRFGYFDEAVNSGEQTLEEKLYSLFVMYKEENYPRDHRFILDYEVVEHPDGGFVLNIKSQLMENGLKNFMANFKRMHKERIQSDKKNNLKQKKIEEKKPKVVVEKKSKNEVDPNQIAFEFDLD